MNNIVAQKVTSGETEIFQHDGVRLNADELRSQIGTDAKDYPPEYIALIGKYIENFATKADLERVHRLLDKKINDSDADRKDDIAKVNSRLDVLSGEVKNLREMFENFKQGLTKEINFAIYRTAGAVIVAGAIIAGGVASLLMLF